MTLRLPRRHFLHLAAGAAALPVLPRVAAASDYPARPVHLVVGFAAGGAPDIIGRLLAQWLSERFGQPFVVENRPGADSNLAAEMVVKAPADGYTLFEVSLANAMNTMLYSGPNFMDGIAPVASAASAPFIVVVNPSSPAQTIPDFIAHAKANPGKLNMGSSGTGTPPYMSATMFKIMAGIDIVQVPHRNSLAAITELLAGRIDIAVSDMSATEYVKAGKLHGLAVTTATRQQALPDVPTLAEFLPGYEASTWYGLGVSKDTPSEIIGRLSSATNAALSDPGNKAHLTNLGFTVGMRSPAGFGQFIAAEGAKWSRVFQAANIKPQ